MMLEELDEPDGRAPPASGEGVAPRPRWLPGQMLRRFRPSERSFLALVVQHDATARARLRRVLERSGWTVIEAEDGRAALSRVVERRPALVVLDLSISEINGLELAASLRARPEWQEIPIVAMGAADLNADESLLQNGYGATII
jgi:CheY-like chemotaxis protein